MMATVVVLAFAMMIVHFVTGRRASLSPLDTTSLGGKQPFGSAFLAGFVAVAALVEIGLSGTIEVGSATAVGAGVAAVALVMAAARAIPGVEAAGTLLFAVFGLIALVPALSSLTAPSICGLETNVPLRVSAVALFIVVALLFGTFGFLLRPARVAAAPAVGLGWFGAVDIIVFVTSPVGISGGPGPMVVGLCAAVMLGVIIGVAPELGLMAVGTGVGLIVLLASAGGSTLQCESVDSFGAVTPFVVYAVLFAMGRILLKTSRKRVS